MADREISTGRPSGAQRDGGSPVILVTGGTGGLGSRVVDRLRDQHAVVRVMSRNGAAGTVMSDLLTGHGLDAAVDGVDTVVHCASGPPRQARATDVEGTARLLRAAERAGVSHLVYVSIVGVDRNPYYPYYAAKYQAEHLVERSPVPWTILRSTQFHGFVLWMLRSLQRGPLALTPRGFLVQPIDVGEVADRLVELAVTAPGGRVPDIGGPEVRTAADLCRAYQSAIGRPARTVEIPLPGRVARAWRAGVHVTPAHRYGTTTWEQFLQAQTRLAEVSMTEDRR
jgi:uncharacterized protein YbjT (DUF2867 family)